ncbi:hypothetical protein KBG31_00305 [Patescibacteria group bacterium]|nr:hypothetical protein [Patescibacteria group bacterium]
MFSKILIKLIDQAIFPAVLLLTVRIVSIVLVSYQMGIPFSISNAGFIFGSTQQYVIVNSYSILAMIIALSLGIFYNLTKAFVFHSSHITPQATAKVFSMKLSFFIQNSYDLYSQGIIWLSYSFLLVLVAGIMALFGLSFGWVFYLGLGVTILATVLFILDVEKEMKIEKLVEDLIYPEDEEETFVLKFGEDYV